MKASLAGRRVHIAGSAEAGVNAQLLRYAHDLIRKLVTALLAKGSGLVVQAGKEPESASGDALIFDWTVLETAAECLRKGTARSTTHTGPLIVAASSEKASLEIPAHRRELWDKLLTSGALRLELIPPGWRSGALLRARQAMFGNILVTLGGGAGVEHLAELYAERRHPIIPLDLPLGSSRGDATVGGEGLARLALAEPQRFLELCDGSSPASRLAALATRAGEVSAQTIADRVVGLIRDLAPPEAFYARLLNKDLEEFPAVERFFRNVVDVLVAEAGYRRIKVGTDRAREGFLNVEIFERLHFSSMAVVDLTSLRPNCLVELGYALGRGGNVILTAREGTRLPFDTAAIPCHFWRDTEDEASIQDFRKFWETNVNRGPLVKPPVLT